MTRAIEVVQRVTPPAKASYLAACAEPAASPGATLSAAKDFQKGGRTALSHIPESRVT
jgi:hypothetical protein